MRWGRAAGPAVALVLSACAGIEIEPAPMVGPSPRGIVVLVPQDGAGAAERDPRDLATGVDRALQLRDYRVLPLDIGFGLVKKHGWTGAEPTGEDRQRLQQATGVDAVLAIDVIEFAAEGRRPLRSASWDLEWRLVSLATGEEQWRYRDRGSWSRPPAGPDDRLPLVDAEPRAQPFGALEPRDYRDAAELLVALHRAAMLRLPRRQR